MESPTPYRISTITTTGSVNTEIDLDYLFDSFQDIINNEGVGKHVDVTKGIVYVEYGKRRSTTFFTGFSKKFMLQRKKDNVSKRFDNQLTVIYKFSDESLMNIKMFKNGNVQITGVKHIADGDHMVNILIGLIERSVMANHTDTINVNNLQNTRYKIALINSDFKIGFEIKRDKLYSLLSNNFENKCSFEPCIYPGVKIQYFWNNRNKTCNGVCCCTPQCLTGKGDGNGENNCKKITIAVFQSGCIIITGAQTTMQIDDAYHFICKVLLDNVDFVRKIPINILPLKKEVSEEKVTIMIKKSSIIYPKH